MGSLFYPAEIGQACVGFSQYLMTILSVTEEAMARAAIATIDNHFKGEPDRVRSNEDYRGLAFILAIRSAAVLDSQVQT